MILAINLGGCTNDKEELNHYIHAKKQVQTLTEEEVKNLCFEVKDLYEDVLKEFEIKL